MQLTKQDKIIGGILIFHSLSGFAWIYWMTSQLGLSMNFVTTNLLLAVTGITAGIGCLKSLRWAAFLGIAFFAVQVLHILTPTFQFSFTLGFNLNVNLGWIESGVLGLNLYSLAMLIWLGYRIGASDSPFKKIIQGARDST
jgi:hypothetical protein